MTTSSRSKGSMSDSAPGAGAAARLLERCSDDLGLDDDSEVTVRWGDLRGLHREDSGTGLQLPPLDMG